MKTQVIVEIEMESVSPDYMQTFNKMIEVIEKECSNNNRTLTVKLKLNEKSICL